MSYICYVLRSLDPKFSNRTYFGITNNSVRRLRQHNGELVGGARSTRALRPLTYYIKINNLTKSQALSIERKIHIMRKRNRKYSGLNGSVACVAHFIDGNVIKKENVTYYNLNNEPNKN